MRIGKDDEVCQMLKSGPIRVGKGRMGKTGNIGCVDSALVLAQMRNRTELLIAVKPTVQMEDFFY